MENSFEIKGYWYLPENLNNKVAGTLYYVPNEEIILELIGSLDYPDEHDFSIFLDKSNPVNVIYGESSDAKSITLFDCFSYGSVNFSSSFPIQKFTVQYVLSGIHIDQKSNTAFNGSTIKFPYLTEWVNNYRIKYSIPFKNDRAHGFNLSYDLDNSNVISVQLDNDLAFELEFTCSPPNGLYQEDLIVHQGYLLHLNSNVDLSFLDLLQKAAKFKMFLTLGTLKTITYNSISFYSPDNYQELNGGRKYFHPIELFYNQHNTLVTSKKSSKEFLFKYDVIETSFEKIIKRWYSFDSQMAPILKHLIESIKTKNIFNTGDFLIIVQALEGYCTRFRPNFPKKGKFIKLKEQLENLKDEFSMVPGIKNAILDIDTAVNSRHYYSHFFTKKPNAHVADGIELYKLTRPLKALLICCVLHETGFGQQEIVNVMNTHN